ncbi:cache domain-containing protein [Succinivibrio sp.]|uniref:cache domain-containing protein n=1 Tax=Succinivibrio sp. TaxID=2053619 RepID=UPI00258AB790|nr:cache domain-containing protein [Succinivibrio sp.]MDD6205613.1 cache domain-containing protein [Succinivibrio sp.]
MKNMAGFIPLFLLVFFLSFIFLTAVSVYTVKQMTERSIQESNQVISQVIKDHLKESIIKPLINSNSMAKDDYLVELLSNENSESEKSIKSYLRGIKNGYGYDFCYVVSDKTKKYFSSNGLKKIIAPESNEIDKWYTRFLSKDKDLDLVVEKEELSSDKLTIFFDNRITDKTGKFLGVTGVAIHLEQLQNSIKFLENKFDVQISLVDRNGNIIESDLEKMANIIVEGIESGINNNSDILTDDNNEIYKNPRIILNTKLFLVVKNKKTGGSSLFLKVIFVNSLFSSSCLKLILCL